MDPKGKSRQIWAAVNEFGANVGASTVGKWRRGGYPMLYQVGVVLIQKQAKCSPFPSLSESKLTCNLAKQVVASANDMRVLRKQLSVPVCGFDSFHAIHCSILTIFIVSLLYCQEFFSLSELA